MGQWHLLLKHQGEGCLACQFAEVGSLGLLGSQREPGSQK